MEVPALTFGLLSPTEGRQKIDLKCAQNGEGSPLTSKPTYMPRVFTRFFPEARKGAPADPGGATALYGVLVALEFVGLVNFWVLTPY